VDSSWIREANWFYVESSFRLLQAYLSSKKEDNLREEYSDRTILECIYAANRMASYFHARMYLSLEGGLAESALEQGLIDQDVIKEYEGPLFGHKILEPDWGFLNSCLMMKQEYVFPKHSLEKPELSNLDEDLKELWQSGADFQIDS
jgi:hypothetical protein